MVAESKAGRRVAIVTGGARGLGNGIAQRLARDGFDIVLWDILFDEDADSRIAFQPMLRQIVDVADIASVSRAFDDILSKADAVEVLVNNAGINGPIAHCADYPLDQWHRILDINLTGVFNCCRVTIPHMVSRGYGRIVNIASIAGKEGNAGQVAYAATKGGVIALTKSIAKELATSGVTANCIAPTMAETDLLKQMTPEFITSIKAKIPMGRLVKIEEVAALASWIASKECSFTTGFTFDITGGRATY